MVKLTYHGHRYEVGKRLRKYIPQSPDEYLEKAKSCANLLDSLEVVDEDGIYWNTIVLDENEETNISQIDVSLYSGSAGICYYLLKLWEVTKDEKYLNKANEGMRYISKNWKLLLSYVPSTISPSRYGLYCGIAGVGSVFLEFYEVFHRQEYKETLLEIIQYLNQNKKSTETGCYWCHETGLLFDGGIVLFLIKASVVLDCEIAKSLARESGNYLLTYRKISEYGPCYDSVPRKEVTIPNYAYGSSGTGVVFLRLYELFGERKYLDAALEIAEYLENIKAKQTGSCLIPLALEVPEPVYYVNFCSGPPGTSRFYYMLYQITKEKKYKDYIRQAFEEIISKGVPGTYSKTLWNNITYCCGTAGILHYFIQLYCAEGEEQYLELARECGSILMGEAETKDNITYWPSAYERLRPDLMSIYAGYYNGSLGAAAGLLQMYLLETGKYQWKSFIDDPYPDHLLD